MIPQFDISFYYSQIFWLLIIFALLFFLIRFFFVKPIEVVFFNRNQEKQSYLDIASKLTDQITQLEEVYIKTYKEIMDEVDEVNHKTLRSINNTFEIKKKDLNIELDDQYKKINEEIAHAIKDFELNKESFCRDTAGFIIKKITNKELNKNLLIECYKKINID